MASGAPRIDPTQSLLFSGMGAAALLLFCFRVSLDGKHDSNSMLRPAVPLDCTNVQSILGRIGRKCDKTESAKIRQKTGSANSGQKDRIGLYTTPSPYDHLLDGAAEGRGVNKFVQALHEQV